MYHCLEEPEKIRLAGSLMTSLTNLKYVKLSVKKAESCNHEDCPTEKERKKFFSNNSGKNSVRFSVQLGL